MTKVEDLGKKRHPTYGYMRCPICQETSPVVRLDDILGIRFRYQCFNCAIRVSRKTFDGIILWQRGVIDERS